MNQLCIDHFWLDTRDHDHGGYHQKHQPTIGALIGMSAHSATHAARAESGPQLFHSNEDGTRTPEKHECPRHGPWRMLDERYLPLTHTPDKSARVQGSGRNPSRPRCG